MVKLNLHPVMRSRFNNEAYGTGPMVEYCVPKSAMNIFRFGGSGPTEMLAYCRKNRVEFLVVQKLDRFARDLEDQIREINELFEKHGVRTRSAFEPIDETPNGRLLAHTAGAYNQYFSDRLSAHMRERTKAALQAGRWPWRAPLGYKNVKSSAGQANIVPDPETAPLVVRAFELMTTGKYKRAEVLKIVTAEGLPSRDGNPALDLHTFSNILRNTVYMGLVRSKTDGPYQGLHVPLVSEQLFLTVQDVLEGRRKKYVPHRKINPKFPLSKGIRCTVCGSPLTGYESKGKMGKRYAYYDCHSCRAVKAPAAKIELEFTKMLNRLHPRTVVVAEFPKVAARIWNQKQGDYEKSKRALTKQLETQEQLSDVLMEKYLQGKVDDGMYQKYSADYAAKIAATQSELRTLEQSQASLDAFVEFAELTLLDMPYIWDAATPEEKVRVRNLLFGDSLQVSPDLQISNSDKVNLYKVLTNMNSQKIVDGASP